MLALLVASLLSGVEVPAATPLLPNAPQFESSLRLVAGRDRFLALYESYTTPVAEIIDPETGRIVSRKRLPRNLFVEGAAAAGDRFILPVAGTDDHVAVAVLDSDANLVAGPANVVPGFLGAVASIGDEALVVSRGTGAIVDTWGHVLRTSSIGRGNGLTAPAVAASRDRYLVVDADDTGTFAMVVDRRGEVIATTKIDASPPDTRNGSILAASDGTTFLVVWPRAGDVRTISLLPDGSKGVERVLTAPRPFAHGNLAWDGAAYLASYGDTMQRLASDGALLGPQRSVPDSFVAASLAARTITAWIATASCGAGSDVAGRFLDDDRVQLLSPGIADQEQPALAAAGSDVALAWSERTDVGHVRVSFGGTTKTAPSTGVASQHAVSLGSDGEDVLALWTETRTDDCAVVLASARFAEFDASRVVAAGVDAATVPAVAFNGTDYAVVWASATMAQPFARHVGRDGTPSGTPVALAPIESPAPYTSYLTVSPGIAWTGSGYIVVRERAVLMYVPFHSPPPVFEIRLQRLSPDLTPLGAEQLVATGVTPSIAWDGTRGLLVWRDSSRLLGAFVAADGHASSPWQIADDIAVEPHVAWTGADYLVTAGPSVLGLTRDCVPSLHSALPEDTQRSVAAVSRGQVVLAYERPADEESLRIVTRVLPAPRSRAVRR